MLVNQLRMTVPPEQDAEIIEPGDDALQLDAVHQKDGERGLVLANVIEKRVLKTLRAMGSRVSLAGRFCCLNALGSFGRNYSAAPSASVKSARWIGELGMMVEMACL